MRQSQKVTKNKRACFNEVILLMAMKNEAEIEK